MEEEVRDGGESRDGESEAMPIVPAEPVGSVDPVTQVAPEDHILTVDDDLPMRNILRRILRPIFPKANVDAAENGEEALATVRALLDDLKNRLLLVISDTMMPKMTGIDLYEALRKIPGLEDLPFILLSAHVQSDVAKQKVDQALASRDPFFRFLTKPLDSAQLISIAKELIALRVQRRTAQAEAASALTVDSNWGDDPGSDNNPGSGFTSGV